MRGETTMIVQRTFVLSIALACLLIAGQIAVAQVKNESGPAAPVTFSDADEAARQKILDSARWRRLNRQFVDWVSVQRVYTPEQLDAVKADLVARVARLSPRELEDFMEDMEDRLSVLTSPEAADARAWLTDFLAVARNPEQQLGRERPDVLNMSAAQIRQEIAWLHQRREQRQRAQTAFQQGREVRSRGVQQARQRRNDAQQQAVDARSRAAANQHARTRYTPNFADRPGHTDLRPQPMGAPIYNVSPWGTPIYWHPLVGTW
jgi:hypothetical protein